ncbi:MAG: formate dehydrogenase accessory sulfurtransferase FdhD [Alphaproteobacteria bacterium]|nr:formate dehydrogenase accessory sulfurtransferase FdhD [Alphaproteobacteria bacterium]
MSQKPSLEWKSMTWRGAPKPGSRKVAAEVPVAFVYDGGTEAVMMATPADLEDFAFGFSLNDGIVSSADDIGALEVVAVERGIELRMRLKRHERDALVGRRRRRAGPAGCGLCGVESIAEALAKPPPVNANLSVRADEIVSAVDTLFPLQKLNAETRAAHAAAFYVPGEGIVAVREDVGRHNALDKLAGALVRAGRKASEGAILMTSRVSVELVQKAAHMGSCVLAAVSAPTALALEEAKAAGITIAGIVRQDGFEIFTHPERIRLEAAADA